MTDTKHPYRVPFVTNVVIFDLKGSIVDDEDSFSTLATLCSQSEANRISTVTISIHYLVHWALEGEITGTHSIVTLVVLVFSTSDLITDEGT